MSKAPNIKNDTSLLRTQNLSIGYPGNKNKSIVLATDINLHFQLGKLYCLIGENGSGKSTLIKTLIGFLSGIEGWVSVKGRALNEYSNHELSTIISIVLTGQTFAANLKVLELIALGRYPYTSWSGELSDEDSAVIKKVVMEMGIQELLTKKIFELSDGERQKVMIARALVQDTEIILLDEPTAFLDLPYKMEIMQLLSQIAHQQKKCILMSTHNLDLAIQLADEIILITKDRNILHGIPEDLAINGAYEKVYSGDRSHFDLQSGNYLLNRENKKRIAVEGTGILRTWTIRALERTGYAVIENDFSTDLSVIISEEFGLTVWTLDRKGKQEKFKKIEEVLDCLQE